MHKLPYESTEFNVTEFVEFVKGSFSHEHYLAIYEDIQRHCEGQDPLACAWDHYVNFGIGEGREIHEIGCRTRLTTYLAELDTPVLEIGPFLNPCVIGNNVKYFEVLDTAGLQERAENVGYPSRHVPQIDFVHPSGDLSIVDQAFGHVVSSHCIEHQPDLIRHLREVEQVLDTGGSYFVICPDKRLCCDYFIAETRLIDVLSAHREGRRVHTQKSVLEHRTRTTHNNTIDHWHGKHGAPISGQVKLEQIQRAFDEIDAAEGGYIDVHTWIFTPISFLFIVDELRSMGYFNLTVDAIYPPVYGSNEFVAVLKKP